MLFSSTTFIYLFLPFVLICYYGLFKWSRTMQNVFLFIMSLIFYGWGEPKFVFAMIGSIFINWLFGLLVHKYKCENKMRTVKWCIFIDCLLNLSMLFIFKYLNFTSEILFSIFGEKSPIPMIALPIGISFFTFQAMSYVIDIYRDRGEVQKNILNVGLYIAFFPQLIAGPIVRYETVAQEIKHRKETSDDFFGGFTRFVIGLGKKVLLSSIPVAVVQVIIVLLTILSKTFFDTTVIKQLCAMGYIILFFSGFNLICESKYKINNVNMIIGIFIILIYNVLLKLWRKI